MKSVQNKMMAKIFQCAWYDFKHHFSTWSFLTGCYAILLSILFISWSLVTGDYFITIWSTPFNVMFDFINRIDSTWRAPYDDGNFYPLYFFVTAGLVLSLVPISRGLNQNSLDCAFDSTPSGLAFEKRSFGYNFYIMIYRWIMVLAALLIMGIVIGLVRKFFGFLVAHGDWFDYMQLTRNLRISCGIYHQIFDWMYLVFLSLIPLFFWYTATLGELHMLEYKTNLYESFQQYYTMTRSYRKLIFGVYIRQLVIACVALTTIAYVAVIPVSFAGDFVLWFTDLFDLQFSPTALYMMYNCFYLWIFLLLYSWHTLVRAHLYRQIICPPVDNAQCCQGC